MEERSFLAAPTLHLTPSPRRLTYTMVPVLMLSTPLLKRQAVVLLRAGLKGVGVSVCAVRTWFCYACS